jgi:hypothetical protein
VRAFDIICNSRVQPPLNLHCTSLRNRNTLQHRASSSDALLQGLQVQGVKESTRTGHGQHMGYFCCVTTVLMASGIWAGPGSGAPRLQLDGARSLAGSGASALPVCLTRPVLLYRRVLVGIHLLSHSDSADPELPARAANTSTRRQWSFFCYTSW